MKTLIIFLSLACPTIAFAQTINLPGASPLNAPKKAHRVTSNNKKPTVTSKSDSITKNASGNGVKDTTKKPASTKGDTDATSIDTAGNGTAAKPLRFHAAVLSTVFTVPLVRVNFLARTPANPNSLVSTSFLNSAGAGVSYSWGEIDQTLDSSNNTATTNYYNTIGFQLGFLFAVNSSSGTSTTTSGGSTNTTSQASSVFAIVAGVSVLNFQIGAGYELGSLGPAQKRAFLAISYAIPVSALIKGGYKIFHVHPIASGQP